MTAQRILNFGNASEQLFDVFRERAVVAEWRKTLSFLFACLVAKFTARHGIQLLTQLVNDIPPESLTEDAVKKVVVAADCVEILIGRRIGMQDSLRESIRRICLAAEDGQESVDSLRILGDCLGRVGDPRVAVDLRAAKDTTDTHAFIEITAGTHDLPDLPKHLKTSATFLITRYPVTNSQYAEFIKDGGYEEPRWWTKAGWKWRTLHDITEPKYWNDKNLNPTNCPVVGVSMHEAKAMAAWVGGQLPTEAQIHFALRENEEDRSCCVGIGERNWPVQQTIPSHLLFSYTYEATTDGTNYATIAISNRPDVYRGYVKQPRDPLWIRLTLLTVFRIVRSPPYDQIQTGD